ncbi:four-helix bundle copper-binding protein [Pedobacter sp. UBA4863]|uniref:four-helix bundle copper-binding protein n=1 Tax=Pedobacter sp. UBA4863 TaxID=1947060 RepID=UPI0025D2195A|nr:four-helix bundle copper-binding protein [Pedobacter sp. UBA4863]
MEHQHQTVSHSSSLHLHEMLIEKLLKCMQACEQCATACLQETEVTPMAKCIALDRDCADICALTARLLMRNSEVAHNMLMLCETICRHCAEECGSHEHEHCTLCAAACNACGEACNEHLQLATV